MLSSARDGVRYLLEGRRGNLGCDGSAGAGLLGGDLAIMSCRSKYEDCRSRIINKRESKRGFEGFDALWGIVEIFSEVGRQK